MDYWPTSSKLCLLVFLQQLEADKPFLIFMKMEKCEFRALMIKNFLLRKNLSPKSKTSLIDPIGSLHSHRTVNYNSGLLISYIVIGVKPWVAEKKSSLTYIDWYWTIGIWKWMKLLRLWASQHTFPMNIWIWNMYERNRSQNQDNAWVHTCVVTMAKMATNVYLVQHTSDYF